MECQEHQASSNINLIRSLVAVTFLCACDNRVLTAELEITKTRRFKYIENFTTKK